MFASAVTALPSPKEEETKTLTPDFSSGDQVITPTGGKVLSQVTLIKPVDAETKILEGETLMGIVGTASVEADSLITVCALHSWNPPSGTTSGTTTWSIPADILDSLYCVRIYSGQLQFYKLTDCYLVGSSTGSTVYASRLNTATGTFTRNTSTNGNTIGFESINYPPRNISPGRVGLLPIFAPSKYVYFTLNRDFDSINIRRYQIPRSVLLQYYPDFSDDMIGRVYLYGRGLRFTTTSG